MNCDQHCHYIKWHISEDLSEIVLGQISRSKHIFLLIPLDKGKRLQEPRTEEEHRDSIDYT